MYVDLKVVTNKDQSINQYSWHLLLWRGYGQVVSRTK